MFDLPSQTQRWIIVAAAIGFPFAMAFSWLYEWTPSGIVRESEVAPTDSVTRKTGKAMDRWIIAVPGLAVVLLLARYAAAFCLIRPSATSAACTAGRAATRFWNADSAGNCERSNFTNSAQRVTVNR